MHLMNKKCFKYTLNIHVLICKLQSNSAILIHNKYVQNLYKKKNYKEWERDETIKILKIFLLLMVQNVFWLNLKNWKIL